MPRALRRVSWYLMSTGCDPLLDDRLRAGAGVWVLFAGLRVVIPGVSAPAPSGGTCPWDRTLRVLFIWSLLLAAGFCSLLGSWVVSGCPPAVGFAEWAGLAPIGGGFMIPHAAPPAPEAPPAYDTANGSGNSEGALLMLSRREVAVTEGGAAVNVSVMLTRQPTADVLVSATETEPSEVLCYPHLLRFHPHDWSIPQNFTLLPVDDNWQDGDVRSSVRTHALGRLASTLCADADAAPWACTLRSPSRLRQPFAGLESRR